MSCPVARQPACGVFTRDHATIDPTVILHARHIGLPLTSLTVWKERHLEPASVSRQCRTFAAWEGRAAETGTPAEALLMGITQTLAMGVSAASLATGSLARIQRTVAPLPSGFPPGKPFPLLAQHS